MQSFTATQRNLTSSLGYLVAADAEWLEVRDQGKGFGPNAVPDPLAPDRFQALHGQGIHLMKSAMDEVSFEAGGTAVRMRKRAGDHGWTKR